MNPPTDPRPNCQHELHGADGGPCPGCGWDSHPISPGPSPAVDLGLPPLPPTPHGTGRGLPVSVAEALSAESVA